MLYLHFLSNFHIHTLLLALGCLVLLFEHNCAFASSDILKQDCFLIGPQKDHQNNVPVLQHALQSSLNAGTGHAAAVQQNSSQKVNVIFMLADGFGPTSQTFARYVYQSEKNHPQNFMLPLDRILKGTIRTISSDSLVTDSGAGATAYACGYKTYNGAIGGMIFLRY